MRLATLFCVGSVILYTLLTPSLATSATMSFSVYTAATTGNNETRLYMSASVVDNSQGCSHGNYETTARIVSPSNRTATSTSSGLQASTSIAINAEVGTYQMVTTGCYRCSCIGYGLAGFGSAIPKILQVYHSRYKKGNDPDGTCPSLTNRYNADNCSAQCQQAYKCLPYTSTWAAVDGWIISGQCMPGLPVPLSAQPPCSP
jgi:hypothetical protein